jgi:hypothetical protein
VNKAQVTTNKAINNLDQFKGKSREAEKKFDPDSTSAHDAPMANKLDYLEQL